LDAKNCGGSTKFPGTTLSVFFSFAAGGAVGAMSIIKAKA